MDILIFITYLLYSAIKAKKNKKKNHHKTTKVMMQNATIKI